VLEPGICRTSLDQVQEFSHLWVLFLFDQNTNWTDALCTDSARFTFTAKIAPPRLFGKRVGVFSTRSPHRPNPIGLTVVRVESVDEKRGCIHVSGVDMTDGTPILDVKPYIPYDVVVDHRVPHWVVAEDVPSWDLTVRAQAETALRAVVAKRASPFYATYEELVALLRDVLLQDPRSVHQGRGRVMVTTAGGAGEEEEGAEAAAGPEPYTCNIDDIAVQFVALPEAICVVNAYEEARDALDREGDVGVEEVDMGRGAKGVPSAAKARAGVAAVAAGAGRGGGRGAMQ
jgi:tRNA (adenine37-N6)-methyltransferase